MSEGLDIEIYRVKGLKKRVRESGYRANGKELKNAFIEYDADKLLPRTDLIESLRMIGGRGDLKIYIPLQWVDHPKHPHLPRTHICPRGYSWDGNYEVRVDENNRGVVRFRFVKD